MDTGDWIALGAALFTAVGAVFAALAWHQARRSASASERSADSSERSAQAAERTATAEERAADIAEQAELTRQAPTFKFFAKGTAGTKAHVGVLMNHGPSEVDLETIDLLIQDPSGGWAVTTFNSKPTRTGPGGHHYAPVDLRSETSETVVKITIKCTDAHTSGLSWERAREVTFPAQPPGPASASIPPPNPPANGLFGNRAHRLLD